MGISDRIEGSIEKWRIKWGEALGNFLGAVISAGSLKLLEALEKEGRPYAQDYIDRFPIPPEVKGELDNFLKRESPIALAAILPMAIGVVIGSILGSFLGWAIPISNWTRYVGDKLLRTSRFDPASVITAWRRDKPTYEKYFEDLREQGWSDARIETLKFVTLIYPSRQDLIRYTAKEALEPEAIAKYGLLDEFDRLDLTLFDQIGVPRETAKLDWIAHWEHASWMQIVEMLHRDLLTEAEVWEWFRLVEIPPFWRQMLIDSAYTWPTRVDVRRWWDMRTIDETELRRLYSGMGYRGVNLDNYVLWTKVYVAFPDLIARWRNAWITLDEVRSELTGLGMPADRVEEMIQTKIKAAQPERTAKEKDLTKTEIYKGVKKDVITWAEGIELLLDLGYDEDEADYILTINVEALEGSPETFEEFKSITQKWRKAVGMEAKPMSEELIAAGAELVKLTKDIEALLSALKDEEATLIDVEELPEAATVKRDELRVTLHRAESALRVAQTNYDNLLAQWRHGE